MVLGDSARNLDWSRLRSLAERLRLVVPLREGLRRLEGLLPGRFPSHVLEDLERTSTGRIEKASFVARARAPELRSVIDTIAIFLDDRARLVRAGVAEKDETELPLQLHPTPQGNSYLSGLSLASLIWLPKR